ncbi:MAG TPA: biopolymer transporter ExbD [Candidatus Eisenbacteria bacterium]
MRLLRRRPPHPEISLVSTADVAFLLLIFFLSTAIFAVERGIVLELPAPSDLPVSVPAGRLADLRVRADGSWTLDGGAVLRPEDLGRAIAARLASVPDLVVRIAVADAAPYAALVGALDQVKLAGARAVTIQTEDRS